MPKQTLTRDEVLFWLNDRCDTVVHVDVVIEGNVDVVEGNVDVVIEGNPFGTSVFSSSGVLQHWHQTGAVVLLDVGGSEGRSEIEGLYFIEHLIKHDVATASNDDHDDVDVALSKLPVDVSGSNIDLSQLPADVSAWERGRTVGIELAERVWLLIATEGNELDA